MLWRLVAASHALNHLPAPRILPKLCPRDHLQHGENPTEAHIPSLRLISFIPIRSSSVSSIATASGACTRPQASLGISHIEGRLQSCYLRLTTATVVRHVVRASERVTIRQGLSF